MAKGTLGILTGGGDVPGLNPVIRAVTIRAIKEGYKVIGIKNGWKGLTMIDRTKPADNQEYCRPLDIATVSTIARTGGTFLHSSRTNPLTVKKDLVPDHLKGDYKADVNDLTPEVIANLKHLGIELLIPIGGDDTLSYGAHLDKVGFQVIAIPKTMDNDVPGTEYCMGFSTCLSRTVELTHQLRTCAGSHERILVLEAFGRYAGFSALYPTFAGAADRCLIPEHKFSFEKITELAIRDRELNPSRYSVVLVSEGAMPEGSEGMLFEGSEVDGFGHKKLGGIGELVAKKIKELSPKFNNGQKIETLYQKIGYFVRSGAPDAVDSMVGLMYGNLAMDLIKQGRSRLMVCLNNGQYGHVPVETVIKSQKFVEVPRQYDPERYRPNYTNFTGRTMWGL